MITLHYDKGTLLIDGSWRIPYSSWDPRVNAHRALALHYKDISSYLHNNGIKYIDRVLDAVPCPELSHNTQLRRYQAEALKTWNTVGRWGVIVLPTGSGKTHVGIAAISMLNTPALIVVPTLDLVDQWRSLLSKEFRIDIGVYGGGEYTLRAITVSTYDSAYLRAQELGNRFPLIIFDEVHHLAAPSYSQIAEMCVSPFRMGLTATYEREDGAHRELPRLVGGKVYELLVPDLAGSYLSEYSISRIFIELTSSEQKEYNHLYQKFRAYLQSRRMVLKSPMDFKKFIMMTGRDVKAREALLARSRALSIALNSSSKIEALRQILEDGPTERILIFTQHNSLVHRISKEFLIPAITFRTPKNERREILERFRRGMYRSIVTSKVLDEGIDVPDASTAVILSGTGSGREFVQRLGRILRKKKGKKAHLIEIVAKATTETWMSRRRRSRHNHQIQG